LSWLIPLAGWRESTAEKRAARRRHEEAADRRARELLKIAVDGKVPESVRITAIKDALDRAGVSARTAIDVDVTAKPYEQLLTNLPRLGGGSRAEWRRSQGIADDSDSHRPTALPAADMSQPMDAEVIDVEQDEVESIAAVLVSLRLSARLRHGHADERKERIALKLVVATFFLLAAYVTVEGIRSLATGEEPESSPLAIGLLIASLIVMPIVAGAKKRSAPNSTTT
jgi:hypothetical protein